MQVIIGVYVLFGGMGMTVAQAVLTGHSSPQRGPEIEEMARSGKLAVFRIRSIANAYSILNQLERRERVVLLLLDGKRTIQDVAKLIHRSEIQVAHVLVRLLQQGYVEFQGAA